MVYTSMWQVSSGLKGGEMSSQASKCQSGVAEDSVFDTSRSTAPNLAPMPGSLLICDNKDIYDKSH